MSDSNGYDSLSDDDLMAMLYGSAPNWGGLPGKTDASRLNYYQDMVSTLGYDPIQQAGLGQAPEDQWSPAAEAPQISLQRETYGSNPVAKAMFDYIDAGSDPMSALAQAQKEHPEVDWGTDSKNADQYGKIASDYAFESAKAYKDHLAYQTDTENAISKHQAAYTAPDGSKYKNAPLGGNDIYGTASEYDLLGAPSVDDYLQQVVGNKMKSVKGSSYDVSQGKARDYSHVGGAGSTGARIVDDLTDFFGGGSRSTTAGKAKPSSEYGGVKADIGRLTPPKSPSATQGWEAGAKTGASASGGWSYADKGMEQSATAPKSIRTGKMTATTHNWVNGDKQTDDAYRRAAGERLEQAKTNRVRSDANNNAMRRAALMRAVLG